MKQLFTSLTMILVWVMFPVYASSKVPDADSIGRVVDKMLQSPNFLDNSTKPLQASLRADSVFIVKALDKAYNLRNDNPDSVLQSVLPALAPAIRIKWLKAASLICQHLGDYMIEQENYNEAIKHFLVCLRIEEKRKDETRLADLYDELGTVYYYQEIYSKSLEYTNKARATYEKNNDTANLAKIYSHLGTLTLSREYCEQRTTEQKREDFLLSISYFKKSIHYSELMGKMSRVMHNYINIGAAYNKLEQPEKALPYLKAAADYYRSHNETDLLASTLFPLGMAYRRLKQYERSISTYKESLELTQKNGFTSGIYYIYEAMAQSYSESGDYKNAYDYYIRYMHNKDSIFTAEKSQQIFELETKYRTATKEKEIQKLSAEKREKNILLYTLASFIVLILVLAFYVLRNYRNKKVIQEQTIELKEQKIQELEKERQLIATKSVLEGEEAERARLANDLHDGLGGLLSGVKLNLSTMKENAVLTSENLSAFNHALGLLDTSIKELRRIAHNMMPETLMHYGLKTAIQDFAAQVAGGQYSIGFSAFGDDFRYKRELELTLYRITQELVNNAIKHAGASRIDVQLFLEAGRVCVQVTDNGKGFDAKLADRSGDGKGLMNIRDRVNVMDGKFDITSEPGKGTEAIVEFSVS